MYLKNILVTNYKSIQKAQIDFEPGLNILIGKNGAGKSNLLQFISNNLDYNKIYSLDNNNIPGNLEYSFVITYIEEKDIYDTTIGVNKTKAIVNNSITYTTNLTINKRENDAVTYEGTHQLEGKQFFKPNGNGKPLPIELEFLQGFWINKVDFQIPFPSAWLDKPNKYQVQIDLNIDGADYGLYDILRNLEGGLIMKLLTMAITNDQFGHFLFDDNIVGKIESYFFDTFKEFKTIYQMDSYLKKYSPIQDIRLSPNVNIYKTDKKVLVENLIIDFQIDGNWIPWSYLSDGTKRLFYIITQCLSNPSGLILIEEPELGIHPHQLYSLMEFLNEQSYEKQIIISTHSPIVLDILKPEELKRINIAKMSPHGTEFIKLNDEQKETAIEYMSKVGDLSYYWLHSDLENE